MPFRIWNDRVGLVSLGAWLIVPVRLLAVVAVGMTILVRWSKEVLANFQIIRGCVYLAFGILLHHSDIGNGGFFPSIGGCSGSSCSTCTLT